MTDELISKTDVVKIVKSVLSPASSLTNVARARRQMLDEINELEFKPEPHWIPVTERLPVEYDNPIEFLCTLEDNDGNRYVDLILWTGCDWENNYTDDNEQNKYGIDKVVGWMFSPIPMRKGDVTE